MLLSVYVLLTLILYVESAASVPCDPVHEWYDDVINTCASCDDMCSRGKAALKMCAKYCKGYLETYILSKETGNLETPSPNQEETAAKEKVIPNHLPYTIALAVIVFVMIASGICVIAYSKRQIILSKIFKNKPARSEPPNTGTSSSDDDSIEARLEYTSIPATMDNQTCSTSLGSDQVELMMTSRDSPKCASPESGRLMTSREGTPPLQISDTWEVVNNRKGEEAKIYTQDETSRKVVCN